LLNDGASPQARIGEPPVRRLERRRLRRAHGVIVGRIMKAAAVPVGQSWMWTLAFGHHEDRMPTHGYAATREEAMAAFRQ
jgi:hypothetical protein